MPGHEKVRVLNGGLAAWIAADLPTVSGRGAPRPRGDFEAHPGHRPQLDAAQILAQLGQHDASRLIDVRAPERYSGESEPIDPIAVIFREPSMSPPRRTLTPTAGFEHLRKSRRCTPWQAVQREPYSIAAQASLPRRACW